jgi:cell division protein FtsW
MTADAQPARRRLGVPRPPGTRRLATSAAATAPVSRGDARPQGASRVVRGPQRERHEPDYVLLLATVALAAVGLLMIYSSFGVETARANGGDPFPAVVSQLGWSLIGLVALLVLARVDYRYLRLVSVPAYLIALGLLVIVLLPPMGPFRPIEVGGSARWLEVGPLPRMHPAELAKLALVVYLAHWLARRGSEIRSLTRGMLPFLVIVGPVVGLVALEPDLGTTGVLTLSAFTIVFVAGARVWQLLALVPVGVAAVAGYIAMNPYQLQRVTTFLDPWADPVGAGFQTIQGLLALGMGGLFGVGLGEGRQPGGLVLPNAHNDFIFALIGQELGFIGAIAVIGLFLLFAFRGIRVALAAPDTFGALLAVGITAWLTFQALINIAVVVVLVPITGITLPFVSDGGSSLVVSFAAVGILLSISRETLPRGTWNHADPRRGRGYGRPRVPGPGRPALPVRAGR